jgi:hypothetical protein
MKVCFEPNYGYNEQHVVIELHKTANRWNLIKPFEIFVLTNSHPWHSGNCWLKETLRNDVVRVRTIQNDRNSLVFKFIHCQCNVCICKSLRWRCDIYIILRATGNHFFKCGGYAFLLCGLGCVHNMYVFKPSPFSFTRWNYNLFRTLLLLRRALLVFYIVVLVVCLCLLLAPDVDSGVELHWSFPIFDR